MFGRVAGRAEFEGERIGEVVEEMSADKSLCRAVAVRAGRGWVWVVGVRIVRRKDGCGRGRFWVIREVEREARVGGWFVISVVCRVEVIEIGGSGCGG